LSLRLSGSSRRLVHAPSLTLRVSKCDIPTRSVSEGSYTVARRDAVRNSPVGNGSPAGTKLDPRRWWGSDFTKGEKDPRQLFDHYWRLKVMAEAEYAGSVSVPLVTLGLTV
jgi:hypothetical protein